MLDPVDGDRADRLARLDEQLGEAAGQRQAPHGREVGVRRPGQVEPVGRGLRRRALVGQHTAGALVDDLQAAEHADEVAPGACGVGEPHAVERERRLVVADQRAVGDPRPQQVAGQRCSGPARRGGRRRGRCCAASRASRASTSASDSTSYGGAMTAARSTDGA